MTAAPSAGFGHVNVWLRPHWRGQNSERQVRQLLGMVFKQSPDTVPLIRDWQGRPQLVADLSSWDVNWSHSGDCLLVGLGQNCQLGVDVERERHRPMCLDLARRYFHPLELADLERLPQNAQQRLFFRLWCAKEAILKACGVGITFGLNRVAFGLHQGQLRLIQCDHALGQPSQWYLHEYATRPGYCAAIAYRLVDSHQ